jgi:hypothetical protein
MIPELPVIYQSSVLVDELSTVNDMEDCLEHARLHVPEMYVCLLSGYTL